MPTATAPAIDIDTGNTVTNTGLIEATCGGSLEIDDSVNNYGATPGTIKASGGGTITLLGAEVDSGSAAAGVAGGTIEADACGSIEFDNVKTIGLGSSVSGGGGTLDAAGGTITINGGTVDAGSTTAGGGGTVEASCDGSVNLNGVTVNAAGATIQASHGGAITLDGGALNDGSATAGVAGGLVEATGCGSTITFEGSNTVDLGTTVAGGGGTVEATHGGAIIFDGSIVTDAGGTIKALHGGTITFETEGSLDELSATKGIAGGSVEASGNCSTITFDNFTVKLDSAVCGGGGTIKASNGGAIVFNGGTINCAASAPTSGGLIEALTCGTITFNGTNIYNQGSSIDADGIGAMILLAGATHPRRHAGNQRMRHHRNRCLLRQHHARRRDHRDRQHHPGRRPYDAHAARHRRRQPTVTNDGTITLVQGCDPSLIVNGDITLAGTARWCSAATPTASSAPAGRPTRSSNANTIAGAGTIGGEGLVFSNLACGVVDADASGHTLVLDTGTTVNNAGTLEATHGGILEIDDNVCNIGGTIAAYGCGSVVELEGVTIKGGMFLTDDSTSGDRGVIEVANTDAATVFDGGSRPCRFHRRLRARGRRCVARADRHHRSRGARQ